MPRDDWAKYAARDRGRRAAASGECFRVGRKKGKGARKREAKDRRAEAVRDGRCLKCGLVSVARCVRTFKDGSMHIEVRCGKCHRFIKWEPHEGLLRVE